MDRRVTNEAFAMLTQANSGALVFWLEPRCGRIDYLGIMKTVFKNVSSICFVLNCVKVPHNTLKYLVGPQQKTEGLNKNDSFF